MKRSRRYALPILLVFIGVYLLIGCIPIPATRQLQPDNSLRPEWAVGKGKPVEIGKTRIEDAIIALTPRVTNFAASELFSTRLIPLSREERLSNWYVSNDRRQFALHYQIRTLTWLMPLCFAIQQEYEDRWLTLRVSDNGVVVDAETTKALPQSLQYQRPDWLQIFSESTRRKLSQAGILSDVDVDNAHTESQLQHRDLRWQPTTRPATP